MYVYADDDAKTQQFVEKHRQVINTAKYDLKSLQNGLSATKSGVAKAISTWIGLFILIIVVVVSVAMFVLTLTGITSLSLFDKVKLFVCGVVLVFIFYMYFQT
jgi:uncharacterized membrane-anchored protein